MATTYTSADGTAPVILSILDSPQPEPASSGLKRARPNPSGSQRRQAILVEPVPPSKKTTPKRVSSSRAKPRSKALSSLAAQKRAKSTSAPSDFLLPSTPKKIPEAPASTARTNGRLSRPRNISSESSKNTESTKSSSKTYSKPLVTAPTPSEFDIDIAALLDKVHRSRRDSEQP